MFNEKIFKAYDIRGEYGKDFDDDFAKKLGGALSSHVNAKKMVVARDSRPSSEKLSREVMEGIVSAGASVINIGMASTPLFYFGVISKGADGGIMVTASHLGDEFNGFKITKEEAMVIGGDELFESTKDLLREGAPASKKKGKISQKDIVGEYVEASIKHSGLKPGEINVPIKFVGNEMVLREINSVTDALNINVVDSDWEIGFEFDADGDRLIILNSSGRKIRGDLIGGLLAGHYMHGKKVVYDLRYSRGVLEYMASKGVETIPSKIGHKFIKEVMRERDAELCIEQSGHMYFKETGYAESSALGMLRILNTIKETGKDIDELARSVSSWSTTDEINFNLESRDKIQEILERIKKKYSDSNINEMDGIRVEYPNWGFLLRPSNTEQKLRLIIDAREADLMDEKREELVSLLQE